MRTSTQSSKMQTNLRVSPSTSGSGTFKGSGIQTGHTPPGIKYNLFGELTGLIKIWVLTSVIALISNYSFGQTATIYAQSTQTQTGTGTIVRDLANAIGSAGTVVSQATAGASNQTYTELLAFTIDINNLTNAISGNSFPVSLNVSAVSSTTNSQYQYRLQRLNSAGVVQSSTGYSAAFTGTGVRTATLSFTPAQTWVSGDRLRLSIEVRSANATTGRTITVSTGNASSFVQYTYSSTPTITSTATGGPWSSTGTWVGGVVPAAGNNVVIAAGATVTVDLNPTAAIANLTINATGTLDVASATSVTGTGTLSVASGGTLKIGDTSNFPTGFAVNTLTGTVNYYLAGDQTIASQTYSNLTLSGSGIKTLSGTVNGILSMEGTATASGAPTYGVASTLQYKGTVAQTTGSELPATWTGTGGVIIANTAAAVTLGGAVTINAPLTINASGSFNTDGTNNYALSFGGNFVNNGTFTANASAITISGGTAQSIAGFTTTGPVNLTKTAGTATLGGNIGGSDLNINGSGGTLNLGAALTHTFTGNWTMTAGTLNGGTSNLNIGGNGTSGGGTFTAATGTAVVNYNAAGPQSVAGVTYNNLTLSGSGAKTTTGATVNGILSMEGTATTTGTAATYGAASTLQYKGSSTQTTGIELPATWSGSGGVVIANTAGVVTLGGAAIINAPLTINASATLNTDATNNYALSLGGNFTNNGTFTANASSITISGTATTQSIAGFTTTGTVSLTKTTGTATLTGNVNGGAFTINGSGGTLNLGTALSHTFTGLWTMAAGTLNGGTSTLNIDGDTSGSTATLTPGTGTVIFNGTASQTIQPLTYNNLTSSNTGVRVLASSGTIGIAGTFTPGTNSYTITGSTISFNGTGTQTIPAFNYNNLTSSSTGGRTLASSGTIGVAGIFTPGANTYTNTGSTIQYNGASQTVSAFNYNNLDLSTATTGITLAASGTIGIAGAFTVPVVSSVNTGSTVNFNSTGTQTIPAFNYLNLTSSSTGARTLPSSGNIGVAGTFTPGTNVYTITGSTIDYNALAPQTIANFTYTNLNLSGSGAKTFPAAITINTDLTINTPATANLGSFTSRAAGSLHRDATVDASGSFGGPACVTASATKDATYFAAVATGTLYVGNTCIPGTWTGAVDTDWNNTGNWSCPTLPDATTDVTISTVGSGKYPVINAAAVCRSLTISGSGTLTNNSTLTVSGDWTNNGVYTDAAGTVTLNGAVTQTISGAQTAFNNLTISGAGAKTITTVPTVAGILSVEGSGTVSAAPTYGAAATLQYNTSSARAAGAEWPSTFSGTGGVIITNTGAITLNSAKVLGTGVNLTINSGATLLTNNLGLTFGGNFSDTGGTFTAGSSPVVITGTVTTQSIAGFTTTGVVSMTKTAGTATFLGNVTAGAFTVNGTGGTLNLGAGLSHTVTSVTLTNGTLNGGSSTISLTGILNVWSGVAANFTAGTSTVIFGGGAQSIQASAGSTFYNLTFGGTGAKTLTGVPTVNNILSMEGTTAVTVSAAPAYGPAATLQYNTAISRPAGPEWVTPFTGSGGVIIANTGTITANAAKVFNSTAPLTLNSGSSLDMSTFLLTLNGNLINNGAASMAGSGGLTLAGTAAQNIGAFTTTGAVTMAKTGATATLTGILSAGSLVINGTGGTLDLGAFNHTITGNWTMTSGTLLGNTSTLNIGGNGNSAGGTFTAGTGIVSYGAPGAQTIAGVTYNNLVLSGSGAKLFPAAITISSDLTINNPATADLSTFNSKTATLHFGATAQTVDATWGSTVSSATNKDANFGSSSPGLLFVGNVCLPGTWTGAVDTDWFKTGNWSCPAVPDATTDVTIPAALANYPSITAPAVCQSLTINGQLTNASTLTVGSNWTNNGTFTDISGTVILGGAAQNMSGSATTFNNLTLSGSGIKTFTTAPSVNGILSVEGTATTAGLSPVYASTATLQYNGTGTQSTGIEFPSTFPASGTATGVIIANTAGAVTLNGARIINAPLTINATAILNTGNFSVTFGGNFVNNGTFTAGSSPILIAGTATQNISGFTTTGLVSMTKTGSSTATLTGNVNGAGLTINGSGGTLNLGSFTHTFTGDITLTTGTLNGGSSTLNVNSSSATAWTGTGTNFTAGTSTVVLGGAAQTLVTPTTFYNLTIAGTGAKTLTGVPTVNNILSFEGNLTSTISVAPTYGAGATLQYNTATSRNAGPEWITPFAASGGVIISSTGTITANAAKVFNTTAPLTFNSGSNFSMSTFLLTLNGNLINNGAASITGSGGLTLTGGATQSIGSFTTTGTVTLNKTAGTTAALLGNLSGGAFTNTLGTLDLGTGLTHTFTGAWTRTAGTITANNSTLIIGGSVTNTAGTFTAGTGLVQYNAAGAQTIATIPYYNLVLSGSGIKTFPAAIAITNDLTINSTASANLGTFTSTSATLHRDALVPTSGLFGGTGCLTGGATIDVTYFAPATGVLNAGGACIADTWLGVDTSWENVANWSCGSVPISTVDVTIPVVGSGFYPAISSAATCNNITIAAGATLTINASNSLTVSAVWNNNGTFTANSGTLNVTGNLNNNSGSTFNANSGILNAAGNITNTGTFNAGTGTVNLNGIAQIISPAMTLNNLTLAGTGAVTFGTVNTQVITINGILSIENGIVNTFTGSVIYGPAGTLQYNAGASTRTTSSEWVGSFNGTGGVIIKGTGTITLDAARVIGNTAVNANVPLNINAGATLSTGNFGLTFAGDFINSGTFTAGNSAITLAGITTAQNIAGFTTTGVVSLTKGSGTATFTGNVNAGGLTINGTGGGVLSLGAGLTHTITGFLTRTAGTLDGASSTLNLTNAAPVSGVGGLFTPGTGTVNYSGAAQTVGVLNYYNLGLSGTAASIKTFAGSTTINNTFSITSVVADLGTNPHVTLNLVLDGGAPITSGVYGGTGAGGGATVDATHFAPNTGYITVTPNVCLPGTWTGSISTDWNTAGNWCSNTVPTALTNVIINAGGNQPVINTTGMVCNNITIGTNATLTVSGAYTLTVSGNWINNGTFTPGTGTVILNSSVPQSLTGGSTFNNLTLQGTGTGAVTFGTGNTTVNGTLSVENGIVNTFNGAMVYGAAGKLQYNTTSARTVSTEWPGSFTGTSGVTLIGTGAITLNGAKTLADNVPLNIGTGATLTPGANLITLGGNFTNTGTFTSGIGGITIAGAAAAQTIAGFTTTGTVTLTKTAGTAAFAGNVNAAALTISGVGAGTLDLGAGFTHTITGAWTRTSGTLLGNTSTLNIGGTVTNTAGTFTPGTGLVNYTAAGAQTIGSVTYYNLTLSGSGAKTVSGATINNILSLEGTATTTGTAPAFGAAATLQYKGTAAQTTGVEFPASFAGSGGVIINNTLGVTLATASKTVTGPLALTAGVLATGTFTITANGTITRGTGWVNGILSLPFVTGTSAKTFYIGDAASYTPVLVTFNGTGVTTAGTLAASTTPSLPVNYLGTGFDLTKNVKRSWVLTAGGLVASAGSAIVNLSWVPADVQGGANTSNLNIGEYSGSSWTFPGPNNRLATSIDAGSITTFGTFAVGEVTGTQGSGIISTPGTGSFTVPVGINSIDVYAWGGGGAGGGRLMNNFYAGGGGGGGGFQKATIAVTPGQVFNYTIGAGGAGNSTQPGVLGGNTVFSGNGVTVTATGGGGGGLGQTPNTGNGGAGGSGSASGSGVTVPVTHAGGVGGKDTTPAPPATHDGNGTSAGVGHGAGGGGGAGDLSDGTVGIAGATPSGGSGGTGSLPGFAGGGGSGSTNGTTPGSPGTSPGGGGGGVSDIRLAYSQSGGTGGNGQLAIIWTCTQVNVNNLAITTPTVTVCSGDSATIGVSSVLTAGTYTVTYSITDGTTTVAKTVPLIINNASGAGTGYFKTAPVLFPGGSTTLTIASIACSVANTGITANVIVNVAPVPTFISAPGATSCPNTNVTYTTQSGQQSYVWSIPGTAGTDYSIVSGGTSSSNSLTLKWLVSGIDTVTVNYNSAANTCNAIAPAKAGTTVYLLPDVAGTITGSSNVCQGAISVKYKVPPISGATSYVWAYSGTGATITTTADSCLINFSGTATSGNLTVYGLNSCGNGTISANFPITLGVLPVPPGAISGTSTLCQGATGIQYSVPPVTNATSYGWRYTGTGATFSDSTIINPTITFSGTATSGNLSVRGKDACGNGLYSADFPITVGAIPVAGFSSSSSSLPGGAVQVSFTDTTKNAPTSWVWSFPGGVPSSSTIQNPVVTYTTPGTYSVTLTASNSCGTGIPKVSSGNNNIVVTYPIYGTPGNYIFTVPPGVTSITVQAWGAGGAGGSGGSLGVTEAAKAGGGGGASTWKVISPVTTGQTYNFTVGAGGKPNSVAATAPTAAGASFFGNTTAGVSAGSLVVAAPGSYGTSGAGGVGAGGLASASIPSGNAFNGGNGGANSGTNGGGGGGSAGGGGAGGTGGSPTAGSAGPLAAGLFGGANGGAGGTNLNSGSLGKQPGGGGGGKGTGGALSGQGGDGLVYVSWPCVTVDLSDFNISAAGTCSGTSSTVTITSTTLVNGTYDVYYDLSGANGASYSYASMIFANGTGTFTTSHLANAGQTTITAKGVGCTLVASGKTSTFTVTATPIITGTLTACEGTTTQLSGSGTAASPLAWSSSVPAYATVDNTGLVTALSAGQSVITYTTANGCSVNATVTVNSTPKISTPATAAPVCFSASAQTTTLPYTIISDSPQTYSIVWSATPANSLAAVTDASFPVSQITINIPAGTPAGTYTGTLSVKNANGCVGLTTNTFTVTVNTEPTVVTVDQTACAPATVDLTAAGVTAGSTPGLIYTYWADVNATTTYDTPTTAGSGVYYIKGSLGSGCYAIKSETVTINPQPTISLLTAPACSPSLTSYSVRVTVSGGVVTSNFGTPANTSGTDWTVSGIPAGQDVAIVIHAPITLCTDTLKVLAPNCSCPVINAPISGGDLAYCAGTIIPTMHVTVTAGETVDWYSAGSGGVALLTGNTAYTPSTPGTYYAEARNVASGCTSSIRTQITITQNPLPTAFAGADVTICSGDSVQIGELPTLGTTYLWSTVPSTSFISTVSNPKVSPAATTTYKVFETLTSTGCSNSSSMKVTVNPSPTIAVSTPATCAPDLLSYSVSVNVSAGTVTSSSGGGTITNPSGSIWTISNIPKGVNTDITVTLGTCTNTLTVSAPDCSCPVLTAPVSGGDQQYCSGATIPALTATVTSGLTVDWYAAASGGTALLSDNTTYTPAAAGTYYAETREITSGCTSTTRTPVVLTMNALPVATISYPNSPYCAVGTASVVHAGQAGGTYSSTSGLSINAANGTIDLVASTIGTYLVTYSFTDGTCSNSTTASVTINSVPTATISYTGSPYCATGTTAVNLSGQTGGTFSSTAGLSINPTSGLINLATSTAGNYTITYNYTNGLCPGTATTNITINDVPQITGNLSVCAGSTTQLTGSGTAASLNPWVSSATGFATVSNTGLVTGVALGSSLITYTDINGCSVTVSVTVNGTPVATATSNSPVCDGSSLDLTGGPAGMTSYSWTGPEAYVSTLQSPSINPVNITEAGTYILTVTNGSGCSSSASTDVVVNALPTFTVTTPAACAPDLQSYALAVTVSSGTVTSTSGTVVHTSGNLWTISAIKAGVNDTLTVVDANTCKNTLNVTAPNCNCPVVTAPVSGGDKEYCTGSPVATISATVGGGETVDWYAAQSGGTALLTGNTSYTPSASGTFYAEARNSTSGCTSTTRTAVTVIMEPLPAAAAGSDVTICSGTSTQIGSTAIPGNTYSWSSSPGTFTSTLSNPTVSPTVTTTYTVIETVTATGCTNTNSVTVTVNNLPSITGTLSVCIGATTQLSGTGTAAAVNPWVSGSTAFATVDNTGLVTGVAAGTSQITYTNSSGCIVTATVTVNASATINGTLAACVGSTTQLTGSGTPAAVNPWVSSAPGFATVDNTGLVTGVATGSTQITYTNNNGCSFTSTVTVNALPSITGSLTVCAGATSQLTGSGTAASVSPWVSASTGFATISNTGLVTGVAPGTSTITYTNSLGCSITATVTVTAGATITGTQAVCVGSATQLTGSGTAAAVNPWVSSAPGFASVDNTGLVTGLVAGSTQITYTNNNGCATTVTVTVNPSATITGTLILCAGSTTQLTGSGTAAAANPWISGSPGFATVSNTGLVTGVAAGTSVITYTNSSGCSVTATVTVNPLPTITVSTPAACAANLLTYSVSVTVSTGTVTSSAGGTIAVAGNIVTISGIPANTNTTLTVSDANTCSNTLGILAPNCNCPVVAAPVSGGNQQYCAGGTIPSITASVPAGETVDWYAAQIGGTALLSGNTTYTPTTAGTYYAEARVTASACFSTTRTAVTVTSNALPTITGTLNVCVGATTQLTGSATAAAVNPWVSGSPAFATVSNTGLVTGVAPGSSIITYTNSLGCSITATVTVSAAASITGTLAVCSGSTTQLTGSGTAAAVNPWVSSAPGFATVSNTGLVTGVAAGSTQITFTNSSGCSITATVTVNALPVVSAITGVAAVTVGSTTQLSDATTGGVWSSSTPAFATVNASGLVSGVAPGSSTITYTVTNGSGCVSTVSQLVNVNIANGTLTITANPVHKTYGTAISGLVTTDQNLFTVTGLAGGDAVTGVTITYTSGSAATSAAGTYTGAVSISAATGTITPSNYSSIVYVNGDLIVDPAPLTVKANNVSKIFGDILTGAPGSTAFTPTGLVLGQTISTVTITYGTGALATAPVGTYPGSVIPSAANGGTFTASNYAITYVNGDILVGRAGSLTILATNKIKPYGAVLTDNPFSTEFSTIGLRSNETVTSVSLTYGPGAAATDIVGSYPGSIKISNAQGTFIPANYDSVIYKVGSISVVERTLTITAKSKSKMYGTALTSPGAGSTDFDVVGLQNGQTISTATISYGTGAAANAAARRYIGSVAVSDAVFTFDPKNYTFVYTPGDIIVGPASVTITAFNKAKLYGAVLTSHSGVGPTEFSYTPLMNGETITSVTMGYGQGSFSNNPAGTYVGQVVPSAPVGIGFSPGNYQLSIIPGDIIVGVGKVTVTADNKSKCFDGKTYTGGYTVTYSGLATGDKLDGTLVFGGTGGPGTGVTAAGDYSIIPSGLTSAKYQVTFVPGTLSINALPTATVGSDQSICIGNTITLGGSPAGGHTYSWTSVPSGFTSSQASPSVSPVANTTYTLVENVTATGCSSTNSVKVLVSPSPKAIAGDNRSICKGGSTTIGAAAVPNVIYSWTASGTTWTSSLANPTVTPTGTTAYTLTVSNASGLGCANSSTVVVTVSQDPVPTISSSATGAVCVGTSVTYTTESGKTGYVWTHSDGGSVVGGGTSVDNTLTIKWNTSVPQTVSVTYANNVGCNLGIPASANISVLSAPGDAGAITGDVSVCAPSSGVVYSVPAIQGATSYVWSISSPGASILTGQGTTSITVDFDASATGGKISVYGKNDCSEGKSSDLTFGLTQKTGPAGEIVSANDTHTFVLGSTGVYSVLPIENATNYTWTLPAGVTITSGDHTNSVTLDFGQNAVAGSLIVTGSNSCGAGLQSPLFALEVPKKTFKAFPVPNQGRFTIEITFPVESTFDVMIYNMNSKTILQIFNAKTTLGTYRQVIDLGDVPTGVYFVKFYNKMFSVVNKVIVRR